MDYNISIVDFLNKIPTQVSAFRAEVFMTIWFLVLIIIDLFSSKKIKSELTFALCVIGIIIPLLMWNSGSFLPYEGEYWSGLFVLNHSQFVFKSLIVLLLLCAITLFYFEKEKHPNEVLYFVYILGLPLSLLLSVNNYISFFILIESISLISYMLVSLSGEESRFKSGIKYLVYGGVTSAIMLYGISFIVGEQGSFVFSSLSDIQPLMLLGVVLFFCGLFFKLNFFPFQFWVPETYKGTSLSVVNVLSVVSKLAVFLFAIYFFGVTNWLANDLVKSVLLIGGILTLVIGNLPALKQTEFKSLMAYSSIAQAGILGLVFAINDIPIQLSITSFYFITYAIMTASVFIPLIIIFRNTENTSFISLSGLGKAYPLLGVTIVLGMISFAGLPPTNGFWAKFFLFSGAYNSYSQSGDVLTLIYILIAMVFTLAGFYYYLRIAYFLFFKKNDNIPYIKVNFVLTLVLYILIFSNSILFFKPDLMMNLFK